MLQIPILAKSDAMTDWPWIYLVVGFFEDDDDGDGGDTILYIV